MAGEVSQAYQSIDYTTHHSLQDEMTFPSVPRHVFTGLAVVLVPAAIIGQEVASENSNPAIIGGAAAAAIVLAGISAVYDRING